MAFDYDPNDNGAPSWADALFEQSYPDADIVLAAPVLTTLAPATIAAGAPVPVTITGTGFAGYSVVWVDEVAYPGTLVSPTSMTFNAQASSAGSQTITVRNGPEVSNAVELAVT